ncbi:MAG: RsmB/NOP family class I SAM-dependent RNA methyltransferase [Alphaproteobacteria bacterium]|nr:RsmB/NOP family class I SAM-dependent RNA methyltransferase [Alphaproteobacteria bacterium]
MTPAARIAGAIELLGAIEAAPRKPADATAQAFFRARRFIGAGDRRAISERVYAILRARPRLAWWIARAGAGRAADPRTLVLAHLLLADRAGPAAAAALFPGGRFAPEPLSREEEALARALAGHTLDHPDQPEAVRLGVPDWLLPSLHARFGAGLAREMAAMDQPAPLDLRVNPLKTTRGAAQSALAGEGIIAEATPFSPWGLRVPGRRPVTATAAFREGLVEIQDEGSQLVALLTDARPGMRVADLCAGAGGKTLALAAAMKNRGQIIAADVSAVRLDQSVKRLRRAGVHNVECRLLKPGEKWLKRGAGAFERVLVDAPCTGTGTWRRNPDARLSLVPADLDELRAKQAAILDTAARLVRPGGRLVYATCSVLAEENEAQIAAFLGRQPEFAVVPLAKLWPAIAPNTSPPAMASGEGPFLVLTPAAHGTDGFFCAVLERAHAARTGPDTDPGADPGAGPPPGQDERAEAGP